MCFLVYFGEILKRKKIYNRTMYHSLAWYLCSCNKKKVRL